MKYSGTQVFKLKNLLISGVLMSGIYSAVIPLGKGLTVHYLVFLDGTQNRRSGVCAHITLHTRKIQSRSLKKE